MPAKKSAKGRKIGRNKAKPSNKRYVLTDKRAINKARIAGNAKQRHDKAYAKSQLSVPADTAQWYIVADAT